MPPARPQKITFRRDARHGRGVLIYCADYKCSHSVAISADQWADDLRLSDIEDRFTCCACGKRGADVRPDWRTSERPNNNKTLGVAEGSRSRRIIFLGAPTDYAAFPPNKAAAQRKHPTRSGLAAPRASEILRSQSCRCRSHR
jgi:hypothetical protein